MKKMSSLSEKELRKSVEGKFRGKDFEYNEILVKIRKYRNDFLKILVCLLVIIAFVVGIFLIRRTDYYKQLKSTSWYEEIAYLDSGHAYTEYETKLDGTKTEITKYKRFYTYTGKDDVKYWHSQTGYDNEGVIGEELKIYVDENDNSKSMEIKSFKKENLGLLVVSCVILGPFILIYLFILIRLYIMKIRLDSKSIKMEDK